MLIMLIMLIPRFFEHVLTTRYMLIMLIMSIPGELWEGGQK